MKLAGGWLITLEIVLRRLHDIAKMVGLAVFLHSTLNETAHDLCCLQIFATLRCQHRSGEVSQTCVHSVSHCSSSILSVRRKLI